MTTAANGAAVRQMSVSVNVLTVDGNRRMSRQFLEQVPIGTFFDGDGNVLPEATPWGYARVYWRDHGTLDTVVGARDGCLRRMDRDDAGRVAADAVPAPADWDSHSRAYYDARRAASKTAEDAFDTLIAGLPQVYFGG